MRVKAVKKPLQQYLSSLGKENFYPTPGKGVLKVRRRWSVIQ